MKSLRIVVFLSLSCRCSILATPPREIIIADNSVVIDRTAVAFNNPKTGFQISIAKLHSALGKHTRFSLTWTAGIYDWDQYGITLGVVAKDFGSQPAFLLIRLQSAEERDMAEYKGGISINGIPIKDRTTVASMLHAGFKKRDVVLVRSLHRHKIVLIPSRNGRILNVSIQLPAADDPAWSVID